MASSRSGCSVPRMALQVRRTVGATASRRSLVAAESPPAGTSIAIRSRDASGVHAVGTLASARRRGLGTALTWAAIDAGSDWGTFERAIPERHWQFLRNDCLQYHETATHLFVHANVDPDRPLDTLATGDRQMVEIARA